MKKIFVCFFLFIILSGTIYIINNPFYYNSDYWKDIGIQGSHLYSDIVTNKGQPQEIKYVDNENIVRYGDLQFVWYNTDLHGAFVRAEIVDNTIFIGRKNLGVGSSKTEVRNAYNSVFIKAIKDLPQNCIGYIDKGVYVIYFFDDSDNVEKIAFSYSI